jgi:hypothetical protein
LPPPLPDPFKKEEKLKNISKKYYLGNKMWILPTPEKQVTLCHWLNK